MDELHDLQAWYAAQCDGDWEHQFGIKIETLDNPGWLVKVDLARTSLAQKAFPPIMQNASETNWISCKVENAVFQGAGGPLMLDRILKAFLSWARLHAG